MPALSRPWLAICRGISELWLLTHSTHTTPGHARAHRQVNSSGNMRGSGGRRQQEIHHLFQLFPRELSSVVVDGSLEAQQSMMAAVASLHFLVFRSLAWINLLHSHSHSPLENIFSLFPKLKLMLLSSTSSWGPASFSC